MLELILWLCFPVALILFGWAIEDDSWFVGTLVTVALLWAGIHFQHIPVWTWCRENWSLLLQWSWLYILIGVAWSMIKVYNAARKVPPRELRGSSGGVRQESIDYEFKQILEHTPKWIAFWPASVAWSALSSWLKEFFVWISDRCRAIYRKLFDMAIKDKL